MSVFTDNEEQNIQLKDIEEMAVKYLCGIEEGSAGENKTEASTLISVDHSPLPKIQEQEEEKPEPSKKPVAISKTEAPGPAQTQFTLELTGTESKSLKKTNAPTKPKATRNAPYSPRNKVPFK